MYVVTSYMNISTQHRIIKCCVALVLFVIGTNHIWHCMYVLFFRKDAVAVQYSDKSQVNTFSSFTEQTTPTSFADDDPAEKSLRKLEKKMKAIQDLKKKMSDGIKLEANQVLCSLNY